MKHASRRPRDKHGRFYKKGEAPGERAKADAHQEDIHVVEGDKVSEKSKDVTKASNE
jgi:hypothetical protein